MKIEDKYKWLARDKDGNLCAFEERPIKGENYWGEEVMGDDFGYIAKKEDVYPFIKWEDEEPYHIQEANQIVGSEEFNLLNTVDNVNKPNHYIGIHGLEVEEVLQNFIPRYENSYAGHRVASAIEYLLRAPLKNKLEDIEKAKQNLEQILNYEKEQPHE